MLPQDVKRCSSTTPFRRLLVQMPTALENEWTADKLVNVVHNLRTYPIESVRHIYPGMKVMAVTPVSDEVHQQYLQIIRGMAEIADMVVHDISFIEQDDYSTSDNHDDDMDYDQQLTEELPIKD